MTSNSVQRSMSSIAPAHVPVKITNSRLPEAVRIEVLNERHDVRQLSQMIGRAYTLGGEPVIEALCRYHYPKDTSVLQKLEIMEEKSKVLFAEDDLAETISEGLSCVVVMKNDPDHYVGVVFAETYKGPPCAVRDDDAFCRNAQGIVNAVHAKSLPVLAAFPVGKLAYISHVAVLPENQGYGITPATYDFLHLRLVQHGFEAAYAVVSSEAMAQGCIRRSSFKRIADIKYKDYEDTEGRKVFAGAPKHSSSIKCLLKLF